MSRKFLRRISRILLTMSVRRKLILCYIITCFIPLFIIFSVSYRRMGQSLRQEEETRIRESMTQAIRSVESSIAVYDNLSDYLAYSTSIAQTAGGEYDNIYEMYTQISTVLDPMIQSLKYFHPEVGRVTIYSRNCTVPHGDSLAPLSDAESAPWYDMALESSDCVWFMDHENCIAASVRRMPLLERFHTSGILYVSVDYDTLLAPFNECTVDGDNALRISDSSGQVLFSSGSEQLLANGGVHSYSEELRGLLWEVQWIVSNEATGRVMQPLRNLIVLMILLAFISSVFLFLFVDRTIAGRISALTSSVRQVEEGDLSVPFGAEEVDPENADEIGQLTHGLRKMLGQINTLIHEVYESRITQKEYELKALQNQINPHFLYNTLSMINWKAIEVGQQDISKVTLALSNFYRTALNRGRKMTLLKDEIRNIRSYLEIQSMMQDDSFDVSYEIDDRVLDAWSLNLILQPLVENAIEHGVRELTDRRGCITVIAAMEDEKVILQVRDNGPGMAEETARRIITQESHGYGVRNVHERIRLHYGEPYGLAIKSSSEGTTCTITFPLQRENQEKL